MKTGRLGHVMQEKRVEKDGKVVTVHVDFT